MEQTTNRASSAVTLPSYAEAFSGKHACCFTGHRPSGLPKEQSSQFTLLSAYLMEAICAAADAGVTHFLAGGAQGFDMLAAEAVLFLRETQGLPLTLALALPSKQQADRWPTPDRERYDIILSKADEVFYAGETNDTVNMHRRNRYLVDHADCCICYLKKMKGGTLYTVNYAMECGISVYNLALLV